MKITNQLYKQIEKEVELGYIIKQKYETLAHYNYNRTATFERRWNDATIIARGLIIDEANRDIIAQPFKKFFNYHEIHQHTIPLHLPHETTIKFDGVFAYSFYYKGEMKFATRWNINTEKAQLAESMFKQNHTDLKLPEHINVMYEVIHPETKILCDYDYSALVVIGAYDLKTGKDFNHTELDDFCTEHGLTVVEKAPYDIFTVLSMASTLDKNKEGWVIRFDNGLRIKVKGKEYVELARLMHGFSDKQLTLQWSKYKGSEIRSNPTIPEEFRDLLGNKLDKLDAYETKLLKEIEKEYATLKHAENQKEFADWVIANYKSPMTAFLFKRRAGKSLNIRQYVLTNKLYYDIIGAIDE